MLMMRPRGRGDFVAVYRNLKSKMAEGGELTSEQTERLLQFQVKLSQLAIS